MTAVAVSVLMAVHNGEGFLAEALASVAGQTLRDYEFVIVDDASNDGTAQLLAAAAARDPRITVLTNPHNQGLTRSLNLGLRLARGAYVARIDADDTCVPERLAVQHAFMEAHPDFVGVCCGFSVIDAAGNVSRTVSAGLDDWQVRWLAGWNPPAPHPTYFFRRLQSDGQSWLYDEDFRTAQDFDLWSRLMSQGKTCVLAQVLVGYRRHAGAITVVKRSEQALNCARIGQRNLAARLPAAEVAQLQPLIALFSYQQPAGELAIRQALKGADALLAYDLSTGPGRERERWLRRTVAGLLADAVLSRAGALKSVRGTARFGLYARKHLWPLLGAVLSDPAMALKSIRNRR